MVSMCSTSTLLSEFILCVYDMSDSMSGVGNLNKQNKNKQNPKNPGSNLYFPSILLTCLV